MIINESYDKSLWLVVHSDKKNRNMIIDFMNSIPDRLYDTMRMFANIACSCMKDNSFYLDKSNSIIARDGIMYWFRIDRDNFGLTLGYSVFDGHDYDVMFELTLYPFEEEKIKSVKDNALFILGNVNGVEYSVSDEIEYVLKKDKYGFEMCLLSSKKVRSKDVYLDKIPGDMELSNLRKSNRLVLKRMLSKKK